MKSFIIQITLSFASSILAAQPARWPRSWGAWRSGYGKLAGEDRRHPAPAVVGRAASGATFFPTPLDALSSLTKDHSFPAAQQGFQKMAQLFFHKK